MDAADQTVLEVVEEELLAPVVVEEALRVAVATMIGTPDEAAARLRALEARAQEIETAIARWTDAIAAGGPLSSLLERLQACEHDRARIHAERHELQAWIGAGRRDERAVLRDLRARVEDWRTAARRNIPQGRQVLRKLLGRTRVAMRPREDRTVELSGRTDYGKLFSGILVPVSSGHVPKGLNATNRKPSTLRNPFVVVGRVGRVA